MEYRIVRSFEISDGLIRAIDLEGRCYGVGKLEGESLSVTVFGDDPLTAEKDGFLEAEAIYFELLLSESRQAIAIEVDYDNKLPQHDGKFLTNGLSAVSGLKVATNGLQNLSQEGFELFPNPAKELLNIQVDAVKNQKFSVLNIDGQLMLNGEITEKATELNLTGFQPGVYILKVAIRNKIVVKKFIKY